MNDAELVDILIVDDSDDDVVMIQRALNKARLVNVLHVVNDGAEAMAFLQRKGEYSDAKTPGLVLLDINMPIKGGFEVLKEMKSDPRLKSIPVVMLTTSSRDEDIVKSYEDGACSYISKPITIESFNNTIQQFSLYWALITKIPHSSDGTAP